MNQEFTVPYLLERDDRGFWRGETALGSRTITRKQSCTRADLRSLSVYSFLLSDRIPSELPQSDDPHAEVGTFVILSSEVEEHREKLEEIGVF